MQSTERERARCKSYYKRNRKRLLAKAAGNRDAKNTYAKEYRDNHRAELKTRTRRHYLKNKERIIKQTTQRELARMKTDPLYKLRKTMRLLIRDAFKRSNLSKCKSTVDIIGLTPAEFKLHIESQFEPWMNWSNKGLYNGTPGYGWDIDHITPLSSASTAEEVCLLNHYTNLRPLCSYINRNEKR